MSKAATASVSDDHPWRDLRFQQADHPCTGNLERYATVVLRALTRFVHIVKVAIPYIGQRGGNGLRCIAGCIEPGNPLAQQVVYRASASRSQSRAA